MRNLRFIAAALFATLLIAVPSHTIAQTTATSSPMINATAVPTETTAPGAEATATSSPLGGDQTGTTTGTGTTTTETTTNGGGGGRWGWLGLLGLLGLFGLRGGSSTTTTYDRP